MYAYIFTQISGIVKIKLLFLYVVRPCVHPIKLKYVTTCICEYMHIVICTHSYLLLFPKGLQQ